MKMRRYFNILFFVAAVVGLCSCELETSGNGKLDGMWKLVSVDTLSTSGVRAMSGERIFWSFQHKLLQLDDKSGNRQSVLFRFEHNGGSLRLYDPYLYDRTNGDAPVTDAGELAPFGVSALEENYTVESISGSKMVLRSEALRLSFRKM